MEAVVDGRAPDQKSVELASASDSGPFFPGQVDDDALEQGLAFVDGQHSFSCGLSPPASRTPAIIALPCQAPIARAHARVGRQASVLASVVSASSVGASAATTTGSSTTCGAATLATTSSGSDRRVTPAGSGKVTKVDRHVEVDERLDRELQRLWQVLGLRADLDAVDVVQERAAQADHREGLSGGVERDLDRDFLALLEGEQIDVEQVRCRGSI